jgi:TonB-linked SusC/RagA family outer membrane protein
MEMKRLLKPMRLMVLLLLGLSLQANAHYKQVNKLAKNNAATNAIEQNESQKSIAQILSDARKVFDVDFVYKSSLFPNATKLVFDADKYSSVEAMLNDLLKPLSLSYKKIFGKTYVLFGTDAEYNFLISTLTQTAAPTYNAGETADARVEISGVVSDAVSGLPLEAVSIIEKSTGKGTVTDKAGNFKISVNTNAVVSVSLVGYQSRDITADKAASGLQILLTPISQSLNDVVVVGYGTRKRKELTTSVSSIGTKEINATPVADAAQALQGRVSGVTIVQGSGAPGGTGGSRIRIRGISSITGNNNPLIVIDGYPLPDQDGDNVLNSFGTNDIESIDVLKDAAASAIYGVRASNGVIVITTKRGKAGKSSLSLDVYRGIQSAWQLPEMLNAREYAIMNSEARIASGLPVIAKLADFNAIETQYGKGTDWLDEVFRTAAIQNISLSASGGSEKSQFLLSAGYLKQDGILYKTDFERFNLRFNGDIKLNNKFKIGTSLSMNKFIEHGADTYTAFNSILLLALTSPPTVTPRNADGTYAGGNGNIDGFSEPNPIYQLEVPKNSNTKYRVTANVFAEWEIVKNLKFKSLFGGDYNYQEIRNFSPATPSSGGRPINLSGYFEQRVLNPDYLAEYTLSYSNTFKSSHKLNVLAGYTYQESRYSYLFAGRQGTFNPIIPVLNNQVLNPIDISQTYNGSEEGVGRRFISILARVNYDYEGKYFASASIRRDGSSNFAPDTKFATLPSFSAGWRLTAEPFMQRVDWVNELKLRASYGLTGNPNVAPFSYLARINQGFQYPFGLSTGSNGANVGAAPSGASNPDIRWEKNQQLNIGIDATLFNNKLGVALDLYQRRSKDLILYVAPPLISGTYESVPFNTGVVDNKGIDLTITGTILTTKQLKWNANLVLGTFKNNVNSLGLSAPIDNGFARINGGSLRVNQGMPINFFYGFKTQGIFQNYAEIAKAAVQVPGTDPTTSTAPGDIRFVDINNDGVIDDKDRTNIGNSFPTFTYGFTQNVTYRNFELSVFIQGSQGNKVLNFTRWYTEGGVSNGNYSREVISRWTGEGSSNEMPRVILNDPNGNNRVSDRFVEDASYLRIKNVRLAYALPEAWCKYTGFKKAQLYGSVQNLATFTKYTGMDPEVGGGVDIGFYPQARTFLMGITVDF